MPLKMPSKMPPAIPSRYSSLSSLITAGNQEKITMATQRSISASTAFSSLSGTSSTKEFIDAKIESLAADIATTEEMETIIREAKKRKDISDDEFKDAIETIDKDSTELQRELVTIKRQKKIIMDDIDDIIPKYETVGDAYAETMTIRIMAATCKKKKGKAFDQKGFSRAVIAYYGAKREENPGSPEKYCHVTGWSGASLVKCAHIVPKSLESDELAYLFGVREAVLSDPRNGTSTACSMVLANVPQD